MLTCRSCGAGLSVAPCPFCGSNDIVTAAADAPTQVIPPADPPTQVLPAQPPPPAGPPAQPTPGPPAWQAPAAGTPAGAATSPTPAMAPAAAAPPRKGWLPWAIVLVVLALIAGIGGAFALGVFDPKAPPPVATPAPSPSTPPPSATPTPTPTPTPTATPTPSDTPTEDPITQSPTPEPATTTVYVPAPQPGPTKTVEVVPTKPDTPEDYPVVRVPAGKECSRSGNGPFSAAGTANSTTSCAFANNVRDVYIENLNGADGKIRVYSPTTKQTYDMQCSGWQPVLCVGGKAGRVVLYGGELTVG